METHLPLRRSPLTAAAASAAGALAVAAASALGLAGTQSRYESSGSVLVSLGADAANLLPVIVLGGSMWLAYRGSTIALLLWPGALFYLVYALVPYLVGAPFTPLIFLYVCGFLGTGIGLLSLLAAIDLPGVRRQFQAARPKAVGGILIAVGVLAYAGLIGTTVSAFGTGAADPAWRGHWLADWTLGTPALLIGGILLWKRLPLGYGAAPGLLLVSALGGVVFAVAAALDNATGGYLTDWTVIVVHLVISMGSLAVLWWHLSTLARDKTSGPAPGRP